MNNDDDENNDQGSGGKHSSDIKNKNDNNQFKFSEPDPLRGYENQMILNQLDTSGKSNDDQNTS